MNKRILRNIYSWTGILLSMPALLLPVPLVAANKSGQDPLKITQATAPRGSIPSPQVISPETKLSYGPFGEVTVYLPSTKASSIALFISGDGGWNTGVINMARYLTSMSAIVVGIDIRHYFNSVNSETESCRNLGVDFEGLAHEVQRQLKLDDYLLPVLVGYSSGATLAYATAVQSPKGTFAGALSLGFCPDLAVTQKLCRGSGLDYKFQYKKGTTPLAIDGVLLAVAKRNTTPWIAFQGDIDQVCNADTTRQFVGQTENAELVWLTNVGHGFSVERNWLPQFKAAYARLARPAEPQDTARALRDLPLVAIPAASTPTPDTRDLFAILLTGDGGWAGLDQDIAAGLAARGIPVVGFNSLKYFWRARTPEVAARDLARIFRSYGALWGRPRVLLIGYSFGADVLPFLYTRLPEEVRASVRSVTLLGLGDTASFEFHVANWVGGGAGTDFPVKPEVRRMGNAAVLCIYGIDEHDSPCPQFSDQHLEAVPLRGGHHFGGDHMAVVQKIIDYIGRTNRAEGGR